MRAVVCDSASFSLRKIYVTVAMVGLTTFAASGVIGQTQGASTNTVSGTVRILDRNGDEKTDRSGVVIFIDDLPDDVRDLSFPKPPQISHKDRQFSPRVLPVAQGTTVDFFNDDNIYHNVFSLSEAKTFDLGIYPEGTSKLVTFSKPGLVYIHCNIHPKMASTILVLNNKLFATTGPDGTFQIAGIPDGQLTLRLWSQFGEEQDRVVLFSGGRRVEESFEIRETKNVVQHKNKFGKRYREKY